MAKDIGTPLYAIEKTRGECLIITDEHKWSGTLSHIPTENDALPLNNGAGIVEQFERLAKWKTSRGMRTRVVTVMDIVKGTYGDFTQKGFARDLQEVIRNFVKWAYDEWNIDYLLVGGSDRIVPLRRLLGYVVLDGMHPAWDFSDYGNMDTIEFPAAMDKSHPPPKGRALVENAARLCHYSKHHTPNSETKLCNSHGKVISFKKDKDETSPSYWYFATKGYHVLYNSDGSLSKEPQIYTTEKKYHGFPIGSKACNLIVEGPESDIDDDFYWVWDMYREIPSDLYYACMDSDQYIPCSPGIPKDSLASNLIVDGPKSDIDDNSYLKQGTMLITSDHHEPLPPLRRHDFDRNDNRIYGQHRWDDDVGEYGKDVTIDSFDPNNPDIWVGRAPVDSAEDAQSFVNKVLTYERLMTPEPDGKAIDPSYLKKVIIGADTNNWDGAASDSERILDVIKGKFGDFNDIERYYGNDGGVDDASQVQTLTVENIRGAMDRGSHFVSLMGHGLPDGCCMVWWRGGTGSRPDFDNKDNYFIATADSCSTAQPDFVTRSLGEYIVLHPDGGAVAYIGCVRMGVGNLAQVKQFWMNLKKYGRTGPAAGDQNWEGSSMYNIYTQILYGDPEMPVWTEVPETYQVVHPDYLDISKDSHNLEVTVSCNDRSLSRQNVTIMEGWTTSQHDPRILQSKTTDDQGKATFSLYKLPEDMKEITLTVVPSIIGSNWPNYVPYSVKIPVVRLQRGWKRCTKCQGLFFGSKSGICPKDNNPHTETRGENYSLIYEPSSDQAQKIPSHQPNWRWCKKCKSLFYFPKNKEQGDQNKENYDYGICSGQGEKHSREGSSMYHVKILSGTQTQTQWRWCDKCQVLHRVTGSTTGSCYGGENHHAAGSMYSVLRDVFVYTPY